MALPVKTAAAVAAVVTAPVVSPFFTGMLEHAANRTHRLTSVVLNNTDYHNHDDRDKHDSCLHRFTVEPFNDFHLDSSCLLRL
jgi:hypothetical protein